jgi:hypothetical protein
MSQPLSLSDGCAASRQRLIGKAETEEDDPQIRLCYHLGVEPGLIDK